MGWPWFEGAAILLPCTPDALLPDKEVSRAFGKVGFHATEAQLRLRQARVADCSTGKAGPGHIERFTLFQIARVLVRLNRVARFIVNANHSIM